MKDMRVEKLAHQLVHYSLKLKQGEVLYLEVKGVEALALDKAVIREATEAGAVPFWYYNDDAIERQWVRTATAEQMKTFAQMISTKAHAISANLRSA